MEFTKRIISTINEDGGVLKTGFVLGGFAPIKSKKLLFAVLTDRALNLFENEKAFKKKPKNPKYVVDLSTAFNVHRDHFDAKLKLCVCLMGPDDTFSFTAEKPVEPRPVETREFVDEDMEWFEAILQALIPSRALRLGRPVTMEEFFEFCWDIDVVAEPKLKKPLDPADRLPTMCGRKDGIEAGPKRLCFYPHTIVLCKRRVEPTTRGCPSSNCPPFNCDDFLEIQRNFVAFFGSHERYFVIKMGRGSPCGACELWLGMDSEDVANDVHVKLSFIIERESEKKKKNNIGDPPSSGRNLHRDRSQTQPPQTKSFNGPRLCSPAPSTSLIGRKSSGASMSGSLSSRCNTMSSGSASPVKTVKSNANYASNYIPNPAPAVAPTVDPAVTPKVTTTVTGAVIPAVVPTAVLTPIATPATNNIVNYVEAAPSTTKYIASIASSSDITSSDIKKNDTNTDAIACTYTDINGDTNASGDENYCGIFNYGSIPVAIANTSSNSATISSISSANSGGNPPKTVWNVFPANRRASNSSSILEEQQIYQSMDCAPASSPPPPKPMESVSTNGSVHDETEDSGGTLRLEGGEDDYRENYVETAPLTVPTERRSKDVSDNDERGSVSGISGASVASSSGMPEEYSAMEHDFPYGSNNQLIVPPYDRFHSNMDDMKCVSDSTDSCYSSMATNSTAANSGVVNTANTPRAYSFGGRGQIKPPVSSGGDGDSKENGANLGLPAEDPRKRAFSLGSKIFLPRPFRKNANFPNRQQRHSQTSASGVSLASSAGSSFGVTSSSNTQLASDPQDEESERQRSGSFGSGTSASYVQKEDQPPLVGDSHHVVMDFSGKSCSGSLASIDSASRSRTSSMGCSRREDYVQQPGEVPIEPGKCDSQTLSTKPDEKTEKTTSFAQASPNECTISLPPEKVVQRKTKEEMRRTTDETEKQEPVLETVKGTESKKSPDDQKPAVNNIRPLFSHEAKCNGKSVEKFTLRVKAVEKASALSAKPAKEVDKSANQTKTADKSVTSSIFAKAVSLISSSAQKEKSSVTVKMDKLAPNGTSVGDQPKQPTNSISNSKTVVEKQPEQNGNSSNLAKAVEKSLISNLGKAFEKAKKKTVAPNPTPFDKLDKSSFSKEKPSSTSKPSNPFSSLMEKPSTQKAVDRALIVANYATVEQPQNLMKPLEKSASQPRVVEFRTNYMTVDRPATTAPKPRGGPIDYAMMDATPPLSASSENIPSTRPDRSASSPVCEVLSTPSVIPKRASVPTMRNDTRENSSVLNYATLEINHGDVLKPGSVPNNAYLTSVSKSGIDSSGKQDNPTDYASIM